MKLTPKAKKTKTGQYATGEDILSKLESDHEIIRYILDYRELQKLKSTY
jgi:DNA polymerase-1